MEKITAEFAYKELKKMISENCDNQMISKSATSFFNLWSDSESINSRNIIYDLALLDEPGMELSRNEVIELIEKLRNVK